MHTGPDDAISVVRALYAQVAAGDFTAVMALMADDVEFLQADSLPFGGRFSGQAGFADMASRILAAWPGFSVTPLAFLQDGSGSVVVQTRLTGEGLDMPMLELWTVSGGRIVRCQPFYFDTAAAARSAVQGVASVG